MNYYPYNSYGLPAGRQAHYYHYDLSLMDYPITIFLGALQGVTEFFPISSSGHLLLVEHFFDLPVESFKAFDVVLHGGTLLALLVLFWREWRGIAVGSWSLVFGKLNNDNKKSLKLLGWLVLATIPAAVVGLLLGDWIDNVTRGENRVLLVAGFFVLVAVVLLFAERKSSNPLNPPYQGDLKPRQVVIMGLAQMFALLPGVSRSGVTIASGMLSGLSRSVAAKFSFLMLVPVTAGAVALITRKVLAGELSLPAIEFVITGFIVSALVSYFAASALLKFVKKHSLIVFAVYLVLMAGVLFFVG